MEFGMSRISMKEIWRNLELWSYVVHTMAFVSTVVEHWLAERIPLEKYIQCALGMFTYDIGIILETNSLNSNKFVKCST